MYRWDPQLEGEVRRGFDRKAGVRLKDLHNYVTKKKKVCPTWMSGTVFNAMMKNAEDDAAFKARSEKAARNRRSGGDLDSPVQPSHCQGSVSSSERARKLAAERGGILPTAAELYLDTHMREVKGKGKVPVSDRARQVKETYERNLSLSQDSGSETSPNQIFYETVGGRKKGVIPGLGNSGDLFYERGSQRYGAPCTPSDPSLVSQLSQQVDEQRAQLQEFRTLQEQVNKQKDEQIKQLEATLAQYQHLFSTCRSMFPTNPPTDPRDPPGDGGSASFPV